MMFRILDKDGNVIQNAKIYEEFPNTLDVIIDSYHIFSKDELLLMLDLINRRVGYGGDVALIKEYIELYDKIEKIV